MVGVCPCMQQGVLRNRLQKWLRVTKAEQGVSSERESSRSIRQAGRQTDRVGLMVLQGSVQRGREEGREKNREERREKGRHTVGHAYKNERM